MHPWWVSDHSLAGSSMAVVVTSLTCLTFFSFLGDMFLEISSVTKDDGQTHSTPAAG